MFTKKRKNNQGFIHGGYKQFRSPLVFNEKKKKPKKELKLPEIKLKYIAYFVILLIIIFYVFFSNKFKIKEVIVEGNKTISSEYLTSYVDKDSNILFFNSKKVKAKILVENPQISNVEIIRGIPDAVKIVVLEHENKLIWQSNGINYLISTQGKITKQIGAEEVYDYPQIVDSKNLPVTLGSDIVSPNFIAFATNIYNKFFETTNIKPTFYTVPETTFDLNLGTEAGFYVKFNTMRGSAIQLENLKRVLVAHRQDVHEYVDLRIDGWAYYK